jgi:hypothetical protein
MDWMRRALLALVSLAFVTAVTVFGSPPAMAAIPPCAALASSEGVSGADGVKSANSSIVAASGSNAAYCLVNILYGLTNSENINLIFAMPLSVADGGSGGLQGAWNGRTQGLGGGGCTGISAVNAAMLMASNAGYVASGTDLGHSGGDCDLGVNTDGTYNYRFIQDFIRTAIKQQVLWSKTLADIYYGMMPRYDYWNGCSTGGRQGYLLAQELGDQLDGILAAAPAIYWTRFQTAQMWGQIVMKQLVGSAISPAKLAQVAASAVQACDGADGLTDGIVDDPRTCNFNANSNICGHAGAPAVNCLTAAEANAVNRIWDGPRNRRGTKIWFGLDRGSDFFILNGPTPFALGTVQFHWNEHNRNFDWTTVHVKGYAQIAQDGSTNIADVTDTFGPLDQFKKHGGKLLTWVGANDQFIYPRGVINYYRQMATRYSSDGKPDFTNLQKFYRLFRAPGVGHCGFNSSGPVPVDPFGALVDWVEHNKPPQTLLASGGSAAPKKGRTRPLCPYPTTAIYRGAGSINNAKNFSCGGSLETTKVVCNDVLARYKQEARGALDYRGTGVHPRDCTSSSVARN